MKHILSVVALFATLHASAQQVNPVPDYVFANRMSAGRNTVTDTAAYFSIGPRYGATKGFMPPIVGDTATFSSGKRNGLLIFSVQKNKFLYWDSVRVQWSDMAGSSGSYIVAGDTATMLAPYLRKADTTAMLSKYLRKSDTATLSNRINLKLNASDTASLSSRINLKVNISDTSTMLSPYLRKVDTTAMLSPYYRSATASAALALKLNISDTSSMLTNYVRHAGYALTKSGQSFLVDTAAMATRARVQKGIDSVVSIIPAAGIGGSGTTNYVPKFTASGIIGNSQIVDNGSAGVNVVSKLNIRDDGPFITGANISGGANNMAIGTSSSGGFVGIFVNNSERVRIFSNGRSFFGSSPTDAGYQMDVNGTLRTINSAHFATTSGSVGINTTSPEGKLQINSASFSLLSTTFTGDAIVINSGAVTSSLNAYGSGINFTRLGDNGTRSSGISIVQSGSDNDQTGIAFFTHNSNSGSDPMQESARLRHDGELLIGTASDAGDYKLQISGNIYNTGSITTGAPSGGSIKPWKIGEADTVSPTSPNRTLRVEVDGVVYYIHAKTTND